MALDPILSLAHSMAHGKGVFAVLVGSGISRSSGIPTGWEITLDLVRQLAAMRHEDAGPDPAAWFERTFGEPPTYSGVVGHLGPTPAHRRNILQEYIEPTPEEREAGLKVPTSAHRAIARLVADGYVRVVLTTNFDRLMETALAEAGVQPSVIASGDQARGAAPLTHQRSVLIKLHGDYLDDRILNTPDELSVYHPEMAALLDRVLDEHGLIVSGWSAEWDIALRAAFERCPNRRYATYWGSLGEPEARSKELIERRDAVVIQGLSADAVFAELEEKVRSVANLRQSHPLTEAAAVATLKRYVVDERFDVRLQDLLLDEVRRILPPALKEYVSRDGGPSDVDAVRRLDAMAATLRALLFHAGRLAGSRHGEMLVAILRLVGGGPDAADGTYRLPSRRHIVATALYAAAYGAVIGGRWSVLRKLLSMHWGRHGMAADSLSAERSLAHETAKGLLKESYYRAASMHFAAILEPLAQGIIPDPELAFDETEMWFSLSVAERASEGQRAYVPAGRFFTDLTWTTGVERKRLISDADREGAAWAPLASGWFGGTFDGYGRAAAIVWDAIEARQGR